MGGKGISTVQNPRTPRPNKEESAHCCRALIIPAFLHGAIFNCFAKQKVEFKVRIRDQKHTRWKGTVVSAPSREKKGIYLYYGDKDVLRKEPESDQGFPSDTRVWASNKKNKGRESKASPAQLN